MIEASQASQPPARPVAKWKHALFSTLTGLLVVILGLSLGELGLRFKRAHAQQQEHLDPGMALPDPLLGWTLARGWQGRHQHHDFDVRYSVNRLGFRADSMLPRAKPHSLRAVVGDSFTFGLGVNDQETFVHLLNQGASNGVTYLNCAIPGYSTDQEALLIEREVLPLEPDLILLVVYLGNDLIDIQRSVPLQVHAAKPYFELGSQGLVLKNTPVPPLTSLAGHQEPDLWSVLLGENRVQRSLRLRLEKHSELFRLLGQELLPVHDLAPQFEGCLADCLGLFDAIVERAAAQCRQKSVRLRLVLMPGRSFVEKPRSLAAQYQDFLRRKIVTGRVSRSPAVIDLAAPLRQRFRDSGETCFYAHDGHLNPTGHSLAARLLAVELAE